MSTKAEHRTGRIKNGWLKDLYYKVQLTYFCSSFISRSLSFLMPIMFFFESAAIKIAVFL